MKAKSLLFLFAVAVILQLAVPASMIARRERVLREGRAFKFRTAPVDPYDAFRGRYVALRLEANSAPVPLGQDFTRNETVYALLAEDEEGYAYYSGVRRERPAVEPCLRLKLNYVSGTNASLRQPFDRFYMEEGEAPAAEKAYRAARTNRSAFIQVRIDDGFGVIEDLYIEDTPIREYLARRAEVKTP